jgi:hypothetical protein
VLLHSSKRFDRKYAWFRSDDSRCVPLTGQHSSRLDSKLPEHGSDESVLPGTHRSGCESGNSTCPRSHGTPAVRTTFVRSLTSAAANSLTPDQEWDEPTRTTPDIRAARNGTLYTQTRPMPGLKSEPSRVY